MRKIDLIATDLDGTLFYPKKKRRMVPKATKAFIDRFTGDGGRLLLVTGRNAFFGEKVGRKIKKRLDYIACNGSLIVCNGKTIFERTIPAELAQKVFREISDEGFPVMTFLFTKSRNMVCQKKDLALWVKAGYSIYRIWQGTYREPYFKNDAMFQEELEKGEIYKIMMFPGFGKKSKVISAQKAKEFQERYPEMNIVASDQAIECTYKGCTKSEGIAFYLDYNQINVDNVLVVGDSGNDVSMFESFKKHSFCMKHGLPDVKAHASYEIRRFSDLENYVYPYAETTAEND